MVSAKYIFILLSSISFSGICQGQKDSTISVSEKNFIRNITVNNGVSSISFPELNLKINCLMKSDSIISINSIISGTDTLNRYNDSEIVKFEEILNKVEYSERSLFFRLNEMYDQPQRQQEYKKMEFTYASLEKFQFGVFKEGFAIIKVNDKFGFINSKGQLVIDCIFDNVSSFKNGIALVKYGEKWYKLSKEGILTID